MITSVMKAVNLFLGNIYPTFVIFQACFHIIRMKNSKIRPLEYLRNDWAI